MTSPAPISKTKSETVPPAGRIDWATVALVAIVILLGIAFALYASGASTGFVYDDV